MNPTSKCGARRILMVVACEFLEGDGIVLHHILDTLNCLWRRVVKHDEVESDINDFHIVAGVVALEGDDIDAKFLRQGRQLIFDMR